MAESSRTQSMTRPSLSATTLSGDAALVVLYGPQLGRRFPLGSSEVILGRSTEAHFCLDSDSISRRHARIALTEEGVFLFEDLGSMNGSYINDERVDSRPLKDGDIVRLGTCILKFLAGTNVEAAYHEEIYRMTILDALTGIHNRRYFLEFLEREASRALRRGAALAMVLFDLDHFKQVNDSYGHVAGDAVLKEIGRRLRPRIRREDLLARYGGEEFVCVLPDTSQEGAKIFAEAVRGLIEREPVPFEEQQIHVTVSLGVAIFPDEARTIEDLIRAADGKLYEAKRQGRNRVVA